MEYKDFFSPKTLEKLNKKSAESLKTMLGDKNLMQTIMSSTKLMDEIEKAEAPYKSKLERLAIGMVKQLYPIIDDQDIKIDAKIGDTSELGSELREAFQPEARRRVINGITQGAALRGTFLFFLFKEHLDDLDPSLLEKYNQIMKNSFGIYDDENAIAMLLAQIAQGNNIVGGGSKVTENETPKRGKTIVARAANFPMLVHEIIKGLYEMLSKKGFKGDKAANQAVVDKVDLLRNEPDDLRYGKFIFDALNKLYTNSSYNDPRIREFFFVEVYQLDDEEFGEFIENAINEELTSTQLKWVSDTMREIESDLREDDYEATGLSEITINTPQQPIDREIQDALKDKLTQEIKSIVLDGYTHYLTYLLETNPQIHDLLFQFVKEQMVFNNYEILRNGEEILVTFNNQNLVKEQDIIDYIGEHPKLEKFLETITWSFYFENIDFPSLYAKCLGNLKQELSYRRPHLQNQYDQTTARQIKNAVNTVLESESIYPEDIFYDKAQEFETYLIEKFRNSDLISEVTIREPIRTKLAITFLQPGYGYVYFKDNQWFGKDNWNKLAMGNSLMAANPFKNYTYLQRPFGQTLDQNTEEDRKNNLDQLKRFLAFKGIPSELVMFYGNPMLKIPRKYYDLVNNNGDILNEVTINEPGVTTQTIKSFIKNNIVPSNEKHVRLLNLINTKYFDTNNITAQMIDSLSLEDKMSYLTDLKQGLNVQPLTEYSEGTINNTIRRWKTENPNTDETLAKLLIKKFDDAQKGLASKLDILVLSDKLKQGKNYLNIDNYSFDDMVKLIRSIPENPEKVKKDAVAKFVQQAGIGKPTAQSYVARFMTKKDDIKYSVENGTEDGAFSKEEVKEFIPKRLLASNTYLDPRAWDWEPFEQMLDALFPSQKTVEGEEENLASTDADKVYDKDGIEIYKGDDVHKCISYNPVNPNTKKKKYGWCVTQIGNTNYDYYRFREASPTFYFIFDRNKPSTPEHYPFDDQWHAFVIQVNNDGESYVVTGADNRGDIPAKSWEDISKIVPSDVWGKIKNLKDYFKPINLSAAERSRKFASGKNLSLSEFKELSQDEKILYVQGKSQKDQISDDILQILPQYKINLEGRSTTLANVAIDSGQKFPYSALKNNEALAKRYAIFRFRHTNYGKNPIPLPYVKFLDEDAKQKYLDTFDGNLTFEYIEKFFGTKSAQDYVNQQVKNLDYIPKEAIKYISDSKIKKFYEIYSKLFDNWDFANDKLANMSDEDLEKVSTMPAAEINPSPITLEQWKSFSPAEKKLIVDLTKKYDLNDDYRIIAYASPFIINDGAETYTLVPKGSNGYDYSDWALVDMNGNVVQEMSGDSVLGSYDIRGGYPSPEDNWKRVWDIKDLKVEK